jgi:hypothetical protein
MFPSRGYFVDLAANDWRAKSNSYSLERYDGWQGLCIEANDEYWHGHLNRTCELVSAVVSDRRDQIIQFVRQGVFGGIVAPGTDRQNANATTADIREYYSVDIAEIFRYVQAPKVIEYFSLDVEGAESLIFPYLPFNTHTIYSITIERPRTDVLEVLKNEGYVEVGILGNFGDTMYLNRRTPNFKAVLRTGQRAITKITLKKHIITDSDIRPVRQTNRKTNKSQAIGVRCPFFSSRCAQFDLLPWSASYEDVSSIICRFDDCR